jgi:hypothetical protein
LRRRHIRPRHVQKSSHRIVPVGKRRPRHRAAARARYRISAHCRARIAAGACAFVPV